MCVEANAAIVLQDTTCHSLLERDRRGLAVLARRVSGSVLSVIPLVCGNRVSGVSNPVKQTAGRPSSNMR